MASKLLYISLVLLAIFAIAFCADNKEAPKKDAPATVADSKKIGLSQKISAEKPKRESDYSNEEEYDNEYEGEEEDHESDDRHYGEDKKPATKPQEHEKPKYGEDKKPVAKPQEHEKPKYGEDKKPVAKPQEHEKPKYGQHKKPVAKPHHEVYTEETEEQGYGEEEQGYGEEEQGGYEEEEHREYRPKKKHVLKIPSQKTFRVCTYRNNTCTGEPCCFFVENGKCFSFPNGDSLIVDLVGARGNALYYSGNPTCNNKDTSVNPTIYLNLEEQDSCFEYESVGLRILPLLFQVKK